jgi:50S ribosomal protein uL3
MPYDEHDIRRAEEMQRLHEQRRKSSDRSKIEKEPRGPHRLTLAMYGHFQKHHLTPLRFLKEFRVADLDHFTEGMEIRSDVFAAGDKVNVIGTSKGCGFAGGMKRHHFHGGNETHGSMFHRKPASGGATDAARVFPGARRPGHMGADQVTVKGLTIIRADAEKNLLVIKGAVPGANGGLVVVIMPERSSVERGKGRYVTFTALEKK